MKFITLKLLQLGQSFAVPADIFELESGEQYKLQKLALQLYLKTIYAQHSHQSKHKIIIDFFAYENEIASDFNDILNKYNANITEFYKGNKLLLLPTDIKNKYEFIKQCQKTLTKLETVRQQLKLLKYVLQSIVCTKIIGTGFLPQHLRVTGVDCAHIKAEYHQNVPSLKSHVFRYMHLIHIFSLFPRLSLLPNINLQKIYSTVNFSKCEFNVFVSILCCYSIHKDSALCRIYGVPLNTIEFYSQRLTDAEMDIRKHIKPDYFEYMNDKLSKRKWVLIDADGTVHYETKVGSNRPKCLFGKSTYDSIVSMPITVPLSPIRNLVANDVESIESPQVHTSVAVSQDDVVRDHNASNIDSVLSEDASEEKQFEPRKKSVVQSRRRSTRIRDNTNKRKSDITQKKKKSKPKKNTLTEEKCVTIDYDKNCVLFPLLEPVQYRTIVDGYVISIPKPIQSWLSKVMDLIIKSDLMIVNGYCGTSWMVLLFPNLILILESEYNNLKPLVHKVMLKLTDCIITATNTHKSQLNDILIGIEILSHIHIRDTHNNELTLMYTKLNTLMEQNQTFRKFLVISCVGSTDVKLVQELRGYTVDQLFKSPYLYSKMRKSWLAFVNVNTHIARLDRIYKSEDNKYLSGNCKQVLVNLFAEYNNEYSRVVRALYHILKLKSDNIQVPDSAFYRYKSMCIPTHTPTTIASIFAGAVGFIPSDNDWALWTVMMDALVVDMEKFKTTVHNIFEKYEQDKSNITLLQFIDNMSRKETKDLRILDNLCYQSICAMVVYYSHANSGVNIDTETYFNKLINIRNNLNDIIVKFIHHKALFCENMTAVHIDIFNAKFLTLSTHDAPIWSVHLMAGILFSCWKRASIYLN